LDYGLLMSNFAKQLGGRKLTQQNLLYESLRRAILDGDIRHGSQLIPTRSLAEQLGIARNSVLYAYERLTEEGFVSTSRQWLRGMHGEPRSVAACGAGRQRGCAAQPVVAPRG
jgi:GntR family transcriptional regulator/MocR family aminotransferase